MISLPDRRAVAIFMLAILMSCNSSYTAQQDFELERSICGSLKEPFFFWLWSSAAGNPNPSRISRIPNIEDVFITSKDGRILRGLKLKAEVSQEGMSTPRGYLLVVQGNAMLADQIITSFDRFSNAGYDVYIFDYRGYGKSEGKRRLKAMLSDYREIIQYLDSLPYRNRAFYGMSFGGIIILDALRGRSGKRSVVIDSSPSRLSDHGCPEKHDPVNNLPQSAERFLIIVGANDQVVKPEASEELANEAKARGASVLMDPQFGHPFMDGHTARRMTIVSKFLTGQKDD